VDSLRPALLTARPLDRRALLRGALGLGAGAAAIAVVGCGGGDDDTGEETPAGGSPTPAPPATGDVRPSLLTTEFVVNEQNRFLVGLLGDGGRLVRGAQVQARFYKLGEDNRTGTLRHQATLPYVELNVEGAHVHDGSSAELAAEDTVGFYGGVTPFEEAGGWGVELIVNQEGTETARVQVPITVLEQSTTPPLAGPAPATQNDTLATTLTPEAICSRDPQCPLHDKVIADVIAAGRPLVVQISTPAYCQTRFCGPVLELLLHEMPPYQDRIDFVHLEVWQDFPARVPRRAVADWRLPGEPFTFFIAADGTVRSKLEAIFTNAELRAALDGLVV
jgi:hypothetical protein